MHDRAAFVHMASDGNERGENFPDDGMNGRWMTI